MVISPVARYPNKSVTAGFTLIEVLIALAILSIALTAIIKATSQTIKDTIYLQDKTIAHWVGLYVINEARVGIVKLPTLPGALHAETTMLGEEWSWQAMLSPTPNLHIKEIHVRVFRKIDKAKLADLMSYYYAN
jgi:general secretion pathway protein I